MYFFSLQSSGGKLSFTTSGYFSFVSKLISFISIETSYVSYCLLGCAILEKIVLEDEKRRPETYKLSVIAS